MISSRRFLCLLLACAAGLRAPAALRVLMIGNSYTYYGGESQQVGTQLKKFLDADPLTAGSTVTIRAPGGYQLVQHASESATTDLINATPAYDFVVLQEQSYTASHGWLYGGAWWNTFVSGIGPLTTQAKGRGARVVYYQTWARAAGETGVLATDYNGDPDFMQDNLTAAYGAAATYYGVKAAPVGEAWRTSLARSPALTLHDSDKSHPSSRGAYLAAAVLYRTITTRDPAAVVYRGSLSQSDADTLRANLAALPAQPNIDINPTITAGQVFTASTLTPAGTVLGTVQAAARQPAAGEVVEDPHPRIARYELVSGNTGGIFALDEATGEIRLAVAAASPVSLTLSVRVHDSNNWRANAAVTARVNQHPYHAWTAANPAIAAQSAPAQDPDGDLFTNGEEYAFGGNPSVKSLLRAAGGRMGISGMAAAGGGPVFYFYRRESPSASGVRYRVQVAAAPGGEWLDAGTGGITVEETAEPPSGGFVRAAVRLTGRPDPSSTPAFFRVIAEIVP